MKILVAVDGSEFTKHMLAYLAAHDEMFGSDHQFTVLTVSAPLPPRATAVLDKQLMHDYHVDECERVFKPIREFFDKQGIKAEYRTEVGHAGDTIAKIADHDKFDMVMMGSHGHGSLANLVMGSVTNKVLAHCKTPVLLIR
ncbi:universal stress protein [Piscinibacter sakaiensis]|uniref:universal stress protein n=1 Tax=Piscinibacter sakaiensis TaxID=1547922 RepID=UPI003AAB7CAD